MKAEHGYIYEIDGRVYVNPELNPKSNPAEEKIQHYWNRLSKWESNNIEVENSYWGKHPKDEYQNCWHVGIGLNYIVVENAQPCKHFNGTVTEIL